MEVGAGEDEAMLLAATVAIGVFIGATIGPRISLRTAGGTLRRYFALILIIISAIMVLKVLGVGVGL